MCVTFHGATNRVKINVASTVRGEKGREKWEMECARTRMGREKGNIDFQMIIRKGTSLLDCETPYLITVG